MPRRTAFPKRVPVDWLGEPQPLRRADSKPQESPTALRQSAARSLGGGESSRVVAVPVDGRDVRVEVDLDRGPLVKFPDGSKRSYRVHGLSEKVMYKVKSKEWLEMSTSEQEVMLHIAAKRNARMEEWLGRDFWGPSGEAGEEEEDEAAVQARQEAEEREERARRENRCKEQMARPPVQWSPVGLDAVTSNHTKVAKGMIYGIDFPWNEDLLAKMGPEWLTSAMHTARTLDASNAVTAIILEKKIKVTGGNNGGKFLFEVRYSQQTPGLHTKLFAKVPFPCSGPTKSDRLSSSVYKQPMDLCELNAYRLLESRFPMQTPKFYYGDISNETTNFILITERVPFAEVGGKWLKRPLNPFEVEGPYDKCKDFQFRSPACEYYTLLFRMSAKIAGLSKSGRMAPQSVLETSMTNPRASPSSPEAWGMNPGFATGEDPNNLIRKLRTALDYMKTAQVVFPGYVTSEGFTQKFIRTLMTASAYKAEVDYWKHCDPDYIALAHSNLNSDNAYFWRDEAGILDCGVFDWGGLGNSCLGHKLWWCINCADYENTSVNMDAFIDAFVETYHEYGGPWVDREVLKMQMLLTCLDNTLFMVAAVPNCNTMCPLKEWATIKDRSDPRIADNIDGKSTLRTTLHVMNHGVRILEEYGADQTLEDWIQDVWVGKFNQPRKSDAMVGLD